MKSCFSFESVQNTDEVMPAKQVTEAALTFQEEKKKLESAESNTKMYILYKEI